MARALSGLRSGLIDPQAREFRQLEHASEILVVVQQWRSQPPGHRQDQQVAGGEHDAFLAQHRGQPFRLQSIRL